ncbi:hypothetical protein EOM39_06720 [Candidatus Gracilibacteria bacterium]|nr:hypothetical protein [Candidatus Gracilibacteria bacterium]
MSGKRSILYRRVGYMYPSKTKGFYGAIYLDQLGKITTKDKAVSIENIYCTVQFGKLNLFLASGGDYANNFREIYGHKGAEYGMIHGVQKEIKKGYRSKRVNSISRGLIGGNT